MSNARVIALVFLVVMALSAFRGAQAAMTCSEVMRDLMPCLSYVQGGGAVPQTCCNGIRSLNNEATSTPDRQEVCSCLKRVVNGFTYNRNNIDLAAGLPAKCGVNIPYKISPTTDCNSVK